MRILYRYITNGFLVTFAVSLVVFTLILIMGVVLKITDLLAKGVAWEPIVRILISGLPAALTFSIPMSALTSSLLVFGRMSADNEITAMKASGVDMWRIVAGPLFVAALLSCLSIYVNSDLSPRSHYARRKLVAELGIQTPIELLEEARWIQDFPGLKIYVGKKNGDQLNNVRIYDMRKEGIRREIRAKTGVIEPGEDGEDLVMNLFDVRIDPFQEDTPGPAFCKQWSVRIEDALRSREYTKKEDDWSIIELSRRMSNIEEYFGHLAPEDQARERMSLSVELNKRLALSLSCFAFVMLGAPLGVKAHRKESSAGIGISLFLVFNFYLFIIVAESLKEHPEVFPDLITWLPVVISIAVGAWLVNRSQ